MKIYSLPLFPLNVVICPGGLIPLRIFEARYIDMVKNCLRNKTSFAIVAVLPEGETDEYGHFPFANIGTSVEITDADVTTVGLMMIRCLGHHRVNVKSFTQQEDGLVIGNVFDITNDAVLPIPDDLFLVSNMLENFLNSLPDQGVSPSDMPVNKPYQLSDATWVANRWVELLDIPFIQKQRLMQLDSPILRLEMIHDILVSNTLKSVQ